MTSVNYTKKSIFACAPATVRGEPTHLDANPKGDTFMYANGRSVIIRNLADPSIADEYSQHTAPVSVARFSPSGYYAASGDANGLVRAWDVTQPEKVLKLECQAISGKINDVAWDSESQRLMAVGEGRERFGHVFLLDSGSSAGEVMGHSRQITSCDFRPSGRPFRAVTASHDFKVNFYTGAPYKFSKSINDHTNAVHSVKYSPSGDFFASVGADKKIFLYDGLTGDAKGEFSADGHTGSIFALAWSPDSSQFITSSGDSTVKLWDASTQSCIRTFAVGEPGINTQQVGNLWANNFLLSLSLSGAISYLDPREGHVTKTVYGHQKGISALEVSANSLFTGSYDGRVLSWDYPEGTAKEVAGPGHSNKVNGIASLGTDLVSVGMDDTFRHTAANASGLEYNASSLSLDSEPIGVVQLQSEDGFAVATKANQLHIVSKDGTLVTSTDLSAPPTCISSFAGESIIGIGLQGRPIHVYKFQGKKLELVGPAGPDVGVGAVASAYSPDGTLFACSNAAGKLTLYSTASTPFEIKTTRWAFHTAKVNSIKFSEDGRFVVSGGIDSSIYVWSVESPGKKVAILNAHPGPISSVAFLEAKDGKNFILASVGSDACIKTWTVTFP
ncbi:WD40 repeat-like protein [Entomophthora muscae]|uniref:WD40 repeat-like protein n=1 Tax=Entomophthora muscae TaxID=34485 RepID=A0ACC2S310_9FUNG|nr:WD40 repeat-like protein [Entomophthora muscae]